MSDSKQRLHQAITLARDGNTAEAKELVENLIVDEPDNAHALFLRGMLASTPQEQVAFLERVLEIDPEHKAALRRMSQLVITTDDQDQPVEAVEEPVDVATEDEPAEEDTFISEEDEADSVETPEDADEDEVPIEPEPETTFDVAETVVGASAVAAPEDEEDELAETLSEEEGDWGVDETVVTAAAVGAGVDEIDETVQTAELTPPDESISQDEGTKPFADHESAEWMDETVVSAESVAGAEQEEEIPDWLVVEDQVEEEPEEAIQEETSVELSEVKEEDLPDWLTEEPTEEFSAHEDDQTAVYMEEDQPVADTFDSVEEEEFIVTEGDLEDVDEEYFAEELEDDAYEEPSDSIVEQPAEKKPKRRSATRGLQIILYLLILFALAIAVVILLVMLGIIV